MQMCHASHIALPMARRSMCFVVVVILATGCVTKQASPNPGSGGSGYEVAQISAEEFLAGLSPQPSASQTEQIRKEFTHWFFNGFTGPYSSIVAGTEVVKSGFHAGQDYRRRSNWAQIRRTMRDFGYRFTQTEGTWGTGFEASLFNPIAIPDQKWWLNLFGDTKYKVPRDLGPGEGPILYRVSGFLSPKGEYGHMGGYDHELYATEVVYIRRLPKEPSH